MKKIYTLILLSVLCISGNAQYTITLSSMPLVGDLDIQHNCTNTIVPLGSSGTGQTWNYAWLNVDWNSFPTSYVSMSSVPNASLFPTGTIGASYGLGSASIFENSSTASKSIGWADVTFSNCVVYSNPITLFTFPFSYGSNYSDTYGATYSGGSFSGTVTVSGSGTGVLLTPGMTFSNVIKVRYSYLETQTSGTVTYYSNGIQDNFYSSFSKFPLLSAFNYTSSSSSNTLISTGNSATINHFAYTGINELSAEDGISIFPNPITNNTATILFNSANEDDYSGSIYDNFGREVKTILISRQECSLKKVSIDLSNLEGGIYYLQLKGTKSEISKKLIIE